MESQQEIIDSLRYVNMSQKMKASRVSRRQTIFGVAFEFLCPYISLFFIQIKIERRLILSDKQDKKISVS